jgi:hypothetical protein
MRILNLLLGLVLLWAVCDTAVGQSVSRFPGGVSTARGDDPLASLPQPDPTRIFMHFEDFIGFSDINNWQASYVETGSATRQSTIIASRAGVLSVSNATADNDATLMESYGSFSFSPNRQTWFKARVKIIDASESASYFGISDATRTTAETTVPDGVYFANPDGDRYLDFIDKNDGTASSYNNFASLTDNTWHTLGFHYDGVDEIYYYVDGVKYGPAAVTHLPDDESMPVGFGLVNGEGEAKYMEVDYIFAAQER